MSTTSTNYGFILPASSDYVAIGDINYNFERIDQNLLSWINAAITAAVPTMDALPTLGNATHSVSSNGVAVSLMGKLDQSSSGYANRDGQILCIGTTSDGEAPINFKTFTADDFALTGYVEPPGAKPAAITADDTILTAITKIVNRLKVIENS